MIRTSRCCEGSWYNYATVGRVRTTPDMRRLEDELCDTKTIHLREKSSNKNSLCVFGCVSVSFMYVCVLIQEFVYSSGQTNMNECVYVSLSPPV